MVQKNISHLASSQQCTAMSAAKKARAQRGIRVATEAASE
jgi:hypothetical protein